MTRKEIIDGLKFTMDMFLFDPSTGETKTKSQLNESDRITFDACEGAVEILKRTGWIPVTIPPGQDGRYLVYGARGYDGKCEMYFETYRNGKWQSKFGSTVIAWIALPELPKEVEL